LKEEALQTTKRPAFWTTDSKLRKNPVSFVSAGVENPLEQLEKELAAIEATEKSIPKARDNTPHAKAPEGAKLAPYTKVIQSHTSRPISPTGPASDDEEPILIFKGRKSATPQPPESFKLDSIAKELVNLDQSSSSADQKAASGPVSGQGGKSGPTVPSAVTTSDSDDEELEEEDTLAVQVSDGPGEDEEEEADINVEVMARFYCRDIGGSDNEFELDGDQEVPSEPDVGHAVSKDRPRRLKKGERKRLQEEGMLNGPRKNGKDKSYDLWTKYPTSMTVTQVVEEVRLFLVRSQEL
jgi:hypothetical protein